MEYLTSPHVDVNYVDKNFDNVRRLSFDDSTRIGTPVNTSPSALPPIYNNSVLPQWGVDSLPCDTNRILFSPKVLEENRNETAVPVSSQFISNQPLSNDENRNVRRLNPCANLLKINVDKLNQGNCMPSYSQFDENYYEKLLIQKDMEILQRERELLEMEKQLLNVNKGMRNVKPTQPFLHPTDVNELIPEFDPSQSEFMDAKQWLERVSYLRNLYQWDDLRTIHYASMRLKGAAKIWFAGQRDSDLTFERFKYNLEENFASFYDESDLHFRLANIKKQRDQSYEAYFFHMQQLAGHNKVSESAFMKYVIGGITDPHVVRGLALSNFKNANELLKQLRWYEEIFKRQQKTIMRNNNCVQPLSPAVIKPDQVSGAPDVNRKRGTNSIRCYNCNENGHISSKCPKEAKRTRCSICQKSNHTAENCFRKPENISLINGPNPFQISLKCKEYNQDVVGLLDTGSPVNLLKSCMVPKGILVDEPDNINYAGINSSKLSVMGIINLNCIINQISLPIRFLVVPDCTMEHDCILGREFIQHPSIYVEILVKDCNTTILIQKTKEQVELETVRLFNEILHVNFVDENKIELDIGPLGNNYNDCVNEKNRIKTILDNFRNRLPKDKPEIQHEMKIELVSDKPVYNAPKRLSVKEKEEVSEIVTNLLNQNIIRKSRSPYSSRIVLVKKKNGTLRLCVDYRDLNKITVKDRFPIPLIEDCLDKLRDKKIFSLIDLKNGFHQIPVHSDSIKYTSFVTPDGQFEYIKTPFGLCNAPSVFQRFINTVFEPLIKTGELLIYIDDILIATKSVERHFEMLNSVFELLYENCLDIQIRKCSFLKTKLDYLGYEICELGIKPSSHHIDAVKEFSLPKNVHELNRFVGLTSFFRKFIQNYSSIAKPLYDLLRKDSNFIFDTQAIESFEELKRKLVMSPILSLYNPKLETELHTDASSTGFGGILMQKQVDKKFHPVFYFSKRTTDAEAKYHSFELEALAIVYALKRFHIYLHGIKFTIVTDCNSLKQTLEKKDVNARIMRWSLLLENYDYKIVHRSSCNMRHVDALSRQTGILLLEECKLSQSLSVAQSKDENIILLRKSLLKSENPFYELRENLVYRKENDKLLFYVPTSLEDNIIRKYHEMGHFGINKVFELIRRTYWFPNMKSKINDFILKCLKCIVFQPKQGKKEGYLNLFEKFDKPFHTIHVDHLGPFEMTNRKNQYIFVIVDGFTKFTKCYPTKTTKTYEVVRHLKNYFSNFSVPIRIISDRGSSFTSKLFQSFVNEFNIKHILNATHSPQSNGQVERMNGTIVPMLAKLVDFDRKIYWDSVLSTVEYNLNNTVNRTTKSTPSMALFGVNQSSCNDLLVQALNNETQIDRNLIDIRKNIVRETKKTQLDNKKHFDKKRKQSESYQVGDYVMIRNNVTEAGVNHKLLPKYKGPYMVKQLLPNDRFVVCDIPEHQVSNKPFNGVYAPFNMKKYPIM